jgi:type II protein arginine methyltransferase
VMQASHVMHTLGGILSLSCRQVSEWMDLSSEDESVRLSGEKALKQELAWATHLAVPAVLLPPPTHDCANYARVLNQVRYE